MTETSIVGANPGDTVMWTCADDSIDKINNINVGKTKTAGEIGKIFGLANLLPLIIQENL